jgi:hypothetical protein
MVTLIGSRHSHVSENRDMLREIIRLNDYDHIFTEGLSSQAQARSESHVETVLGERDFEGRLEGISEDEARKLGRGTEPEFFEKTPIVDESSVTYLDDRDLRFMAETVLEEDDRQDVSREGEIISHSEFEEKLIQDEATKQDFIHYLTGLMIEDEIKTRPEGMDIPGEYQLDDQNFRYLEEQDIEMAYTAISNNPRFQRYIEKVSERFTQESEEQELLDLMEKVDNEPEKYRDRFLSGIRKYDINIETLQKLLYNERGPFQDQRDQNWYEQISEYVEENPKDEILVVAGIEHVLPGENTLTTQLKQDYPQANVRPLDYQQN